MDPSVEFSFTKFSVHDVISNPPSDEEAINIKMQLELALLREEVDAGVNRMEAENGKLKGELENLKKTMMSMPWGGFVSLVAVRVAVGVAVGVMN